MSKPASREAPEELTWSGPRGRAYVLREAPHVVRVVLEGHVGADIGVEIARALRELVGQLPKCYLFFDLEALVSYDSAVRVECTKALSDNGERIGTIQALARSKVVRMGVAVANLALKNRITMYAERLPFEAALRRHCESA